MKKLLFVILCFGAMQSCNKSYDCTTITRRESNIVNAGYPNADTTHTVVHSKQKANSLQNDSSYSAECTSGYCIYVWANTTCL